MPTNVKFHACIMIDEEEIDVDCEADVIEAEHGYCEIDILSVAHVNGKDIDLGSIKGGSWDHLIERAMDAYEERVLDAKADAEEADEEDALEGCRRNR